MDVVEAIKKEGLRRGYSIRTIVTYCACVKQFFKYCHKEPRKVTKKDIREYIDRFVEKGSAGNTINVHLNALKFMLDEILCKRILLKIKYSKKPKQMPEVLTKEEVIKLIGVISNPKHKLIVKLMYSAGLRLSELVKLKTQDLEINHGWVRKGKYNKDRPFIIAEKIKNDMEGYIKENNLNYYIFPGRKSHIHQRSVQEIIKKAARLAGIKKNVHPHTLRHSFATHLIEDGYDVTAVQSLLGHNSAQTTMTYVHMANPRMISVKSPFDKI